jgi:hypothetical protein
MTTDETVQTPTPAPHVERQQSWKRELSPAESMDSTSPAAPSLSDASSGVIVKPERESMRSFARPAQ